MWKPEGWINPHNYAQVFSSAPTLLVLPDGRRIEGSYANYVGLESFEAGADAMLVALKKQPTSFHNGLMYADSANSPPKVKLLELNLQKIIPGIWVFIPDEPDHGYTLTCQMCGRSYFSKEAFPRAQTCPKCSNPD